jgi:hypothetical protein
MNPVLKISLEHSDGANKWRMFNDSYYIHTKAVPVWYHWNEKSRLASMILVCPSSIWVDTHGPYLQRGDIIHQWSIEGVTIFPNPIPSIVIMGGLVAWFPSFGRRLNQRAGRARGALWKSALHDVRSMDASEGSLLDTRGATCLAATRTL